MLKPKGAIAQVYIDNSNLFYEAQRVSAVRKHLPGAASINEAMHTKTLDYSAGIDYKKLYDFLVDATDDGQGVVAKVFGSFSETAGALPEVITKAGFEVLAFNRSIWTRKEKKVDTAVTFYVTRDMYRKSVKEVELVLVTGDSDQVPLVTELVKDGYYVTVAFWSHCSTELRGAASDFLDLNPFFSHLVRYREPRSPSS